MRTKQNQRTQEFASFVMSCKKLINIYKAGKVGMWRNNMFLLYFIFEVSRREKELYTLLYALKLGRFGKVMRNLLILLVGHVGIEPTTS